MSTKHEHLLELFKAKLPLWTWTLQKHVVQGEYGPWLMTVATNGELRFLFCAYWLLGVGKSALGSSLILLTMELPASIDEYDAFLEVLWMPALLKWQEKRLSQFPLPFPTDKPMERAPSLAMPDPDEVIRALEQHPRLAHLVLKGLANSEALKTQWVEEWELVEEAGGTLQRLFKDSGNLAARVQSDHESDYQGFVWGPRGGKLKDFWGATAWETMVKVDVWLLTQDILLQHRALPMNVGSKVAPSHHLSSEPAIWEVTSPPFMASHGNWQVVVKRGSTGMGGPVSPFNLKPLED